MPRYHVEEDLASGALVAVLPENPPRPSRVSLLYPKNRLLAPPIRVLMDWMVKQFAARAV